MSLSMEELAWLRNLSPVGAPPASPGNGAADDGRAAALGHALFFDRRLSAGGQVSCATCHDPERYFTDGRPRAVGLAEGRRNTPTLAGAPWFPFLGWDGRKDSVWSQALSPLEAPDEHGLCRADAVRLIAAAHREPYEAAFGALPEIVERAAQGPPLAAPRPAAACERRAGTAASEAERAAIDRVFANIGKSLEAYVRRLAPAPAPFDAYAAAVLAGDPTGGGHLSASAARGLRAFLGEARCVLCHHGPLLSDREFHNLGLPPAFGASEGDPGRRLGAGMARVDPFRCGSELSDAQRCPELEFLDAEQDALQGAFRTPTLRNVAETAPYMHAGQLATLEEVIDFYRALPGEATTGRRDPLLSPLDRAVSAADLLSFLRSLTGPPPDPAWLAPP
ncbi:cytochrome-c peroxidase [Sorangium sp. So ce542]|uniref:cytochrome-c peroxidase n=1 Tax=Sorangium sp. So ce542 TaxID=3133316 RepID=UPI003F6455AA